MVHQYRRVEPGHEKRVYPERGWPCLSLELFIEFLGRSLHPRGRRRRALCSDSYRSRWSDLCDERRDVVRARELHKYFNRALFLGSGLAKRRRRAADYFYGHGDEPG